jgi:hypothetical protein
VSRERAIGGDAPFGVRFCSNIVAELDARFIAMV